MKVNITDEHSVKITNDMFGLFFEDINYSLDGGLHAEMLENRNFEAVSAQGFRDHYTTVFDGTYAWSLCTETAPVSRLYCESRKPLNKVNPHYLVFEGNTKGASFKNRAYDGLYLKKGKVYKVSFYACKVTGDTDVGISVRKDGITYASASVPVKKQAVEKWVQYTCILMTNEDVFQAEFTVTLTDRACVAFDFFSMIPEDAICGVFRKDLVEMLARLKPSFIRFPGGCVIEGNTLENRYRWKESLGLAEQRRFNWNRWAVHEVKEDDGFIGPYTHYGQTLGIGYYEYFLLCEYIGAKPLPVLNVGLACQYMSEEKVPADSEQMEEFIQDALDLVEFANGGEDTEWGKIRISMGHPQPFGLQYMGIGNEQWETEDSDFFRRYELFEKRIHEKYPQMKLIGSAGPDVTSDKYEKAWNFYRSHSEKSTEFTYAVDEHYYVPPEWMYGNTHFYDDYDRNVKVFAGEYACHIPGRAGRMNCPDANTLGAALAEAAFLTGVERNSDVVVMASYAPLLARIGYTQWSPNLIWFDGEKTYATPSYYVQQMYSNNRGIRTLKTDWDEDREREEKIYLNAVIDQRDEIILKVVNASEKEQKLEVVISLSEEEEMDIIHMTELAGNPEICNSIQECKNVIPHLYEVNGSVLLLKPHSFSVVRFTRKG